MLTEVLAVVFQLFCLGVFVCFVAWLILEVMEKR